jgi:predicted GH43/DUF377 family glycosyl hydrolase
VELSTPIEVQPFALERLGVVMRADPVDPREAWGVLNPACARGRDGNLYLFPRAVATGNYSRIGVGRVRFDAGGDPVGVERLGYVLEPTEPYESNPRTAGCEDPRITFIPALDRYVMTYAAYGPRGPRIALAASRDLERWERHGPVSFAFEARWRTDLNLYDNKDAYFFPEPLPGPDGRPALAFVHRPSWRVTPAYEVLPDGIADRRPGMWLSWLPLDRVGDRLEGLTRMQWHAPFAGAEEDWQSLKIGGGTPPVRTPFGWLTIFHGVSGAIVEGADHQQNVRYAAGAMVLDARDPLRVLYRSARPILQPDLEEERLGIVNNVVFPTAIDDRGAGRFDVYYGMADARIGAARLRLPERLPHAAG